VQQLVNARGAQPHCCGDLSDRQARVMRSGDVGDSRLFGRLQTVSRDAQAMAYLLFALESLAPLLSSVRAPQDA
jgi:hypothetical protein